MDKLNERNKEQQPQKPDYPLSRYLWIGAGLGLYFGYVFRPLRPAADYSFVLLLAVVITLVLVAIKFIPRSRPPMGALIPYALRSLISVAIFMMILETRHPVYHIGGRPAVIVMTTVMGAFTGWLYYKRGSLLTSDGG